LRSNKVEEIPEFFLEDEIINFLSPGEDSELEQQPAACMLLSGECG